MASKVGLTIFGVCLFVLAFHTANALVPCTETNVKLFTFQNPKLSLPKYVYLGPNSQGIMTRLSDGTLAYSEDGGAHWSVKDDFSILNALVVSADGKNVMAVSSVDNSVHVASFVSTSPYEGKLGEFVRVPITFIPESFVAHPTDPRGVVALGRHDACNTSPGDPNCRNVLYLSNDFGRTWHLIVDHFGDYATWLFTSTRPATLYDLFFEQMVGTRPRPLGSKEVKKVNLATFFSGTGAGQVQPTTLTSNVMGSLMGKGLLFATKPRDLVNPSPYDIALYTSHDLGATWKHVRIPTTSTSTSQAQRFYSIVDIQEGAIFVNVLFQATNWGNLYSSDANGDNYAMNLRYNSKPLSGGGMADFAPVHGVDGIYMANVELTPQTAGAELMSKISYDRGGEWFPLAAPHNSPQCQGIDNCHLHLRSLSTSSRTNFFSRTKAIGTVLGTGTVGRHLGSSNDFNTYISHDAGKTWDEAFDGLYTYDISQNGGIIIALKEGQATNILKWSSDGGHVWQECLLPPFGTKKDNLPIHVTTLQNNLIQAEKRRFALKREIVPTGLALAFEEDQPSLRYSLNDEASDYTSDSVTEPKRDALDVNVRAITSVPSTDASARFLIAARTRNEQTIIYVDFNATEARTCRGWERPQDPSSDYEAWSPSDLDGDGCILGKKVIYSRKKPSAQCWVAHTQPPTILLSVSCHCSRQDYMCDYCYAPNVTNPSICELDCPDYNPNQPPTPCTGQYRQTTGYRLVASDTCQGGLNKLGPMLTCPPSTQPPVAPVPQNPVGPAPTTQHPPTVPPTAPTLPPTTPSTPSTPSTPQSAPATPIPSPGQKSPGKIPLVAIVAGITVAIIVVIIIISGTLLYFSSRNASVRYAMMRCLPDTWLPAYMPPDREEGPQYHRLQGTSLSTNDDIFNDDEFLQEDANVLDLDDD